jgi:hypothetical protein
MAVGIKGERLFFVGFPAVSFQFGGGLTSVKNSMYR